MVLAAESNLEVILPMSGLRSRSITAGIRVHGRRVRRHYSERRSGGQCVHVEAEPGVVIVVATWMLDPVACAGMAVGAPRVAVSALIDLHHLLAERGSRRSLPRTIRSSSWRSMMSPRPIASLPTTARASSAWLSIP